MHDTAHFRRRNKDAVFEAFDAKEAVAGAISADRPLDGAARFRAYSICTGGATTLGPTGGSIAAPGPCAAV
jgi:hypothetical protein